MTTLNEILQLLCYNLWTDWQELGNQMWMSKQSTNNNPVRSLRDTLILKYLMSKYSYKIYSHVILYCIYPAQNTLFSSQGRQRVISTCCTADYIWSVCKKCYVIIQPGGNLTLRHFVFKIMVNPISAPAGYQSIFAYISQSVHLIWC